MKHRRKKHLLKFVQMGEFIRQREADEAAVMAILSREHAEPIEVRMTFQDRIILSGNYTYFLACVCPDPRAEKRREHRRRTAYDRRLRAAERRARAMDTCVRQGSEEKMLEIGKTAASVREAVELAWIAACAKGQRVPASEELK